MLAIYHRSVPNLLDVLPPKQTVRLLPAKTIVKSKATMWRRGLILTAQRFLRTKTSCYPLHIVYEQSVWLSNVLTLIKVLKQDFDGSLFNSWPLDQALK